jgi:molybdopterin molybdotransferase
MQFSCGIEMSWKTLLAPKKALALILGRVRPLRPAPMPLERATGLCLAQDVRADRDMPPADRSAMDGYAVRAADLATTPRSLRLVGEIAAGSAARPRVRPGTCARILTGASVPPGADTVVPVEETAEDGDLVTILAAGAIGSHIRRRGEERRKGDVLVGRGTMLGPVQVGLCAAAGRGRVAAIPLPRVTVLCTGEELRRPGQSVGTHELRDSNGPALVAALRGAAGIVAENSLVSDDPEATASAIRRALRDHEVVLLTGGVSVGKYDFVPQALARIGATVRFHGVNMKPGRPLLYATGTGGRHIFGLPGNPLSVLTGFYEFVLPALRRLSGMAPEACQSSLRVRLAGRRIEGDERVRCVPARLQWGAGAPRATPLRFQGSADLAAANLADGVVIVPAGRAGARPGDGVEFRPWRALP